MPRLKQKFFNRKTEIVAQELLGKVLVRKFTSGQKKISGIIVETEAYIGPQDLASHASRGKTERNKIMFEDAGLWYVYMIYGFYHCLNIITEKRHHPSAILIRALEPLENTDEMIKNRKMEKISNLTSGPGKLCQALKIDRKFNYTNLNLKDSLLYIEDRGIKIPKSKIIKTARVGVYYAKEWKDKPLRFYIKNNPFVSNI